MNTRRFIAKAALFAAPLVASIALASTASAAMIRPSGPPRPPILTLNCVELHASIGKLNSWLESHESYANSSNQQERDDYNSNFDMMGSMQRQGLEGGCYKNGSPTS